MMHLISLVHCPLPNPTRFQTHLWGCCCCHKLFVVKKNEADWHISTEGKGGQESIGHRGCWGRKMRNRKKEYLTRNCKKMDRTLLLQWPPTTPPPHFHKPKTDSRPGWDWEASAARFWRHTPESGSAQAGLGRRSAWAVYTWEPRPPPRGQAACGRCSPTLTSHPLQTSSWPPASCTQHAPSLLLRGSEVPASYYQDTSKGKWWQFSKSVRLNHIDGLITLMGLQKLWLQCHFNNMELVMKHLKTTKQNVTEVQLQETK